MLVSTLTTLGADLLSPEIALLLCVIALGALVAALIAARSSVLAAGVRAAVTLVFIDLGFGGNDLVSLLVFADEGSSALMVKAARIGALGFVAAILTAIYWKLRRHLAAILAVAFGASLASSVVMSLLGAGSSGLLAESPPAARTAAGTAAAPPARPESPWVHFIFDELMGVGGLPADIDATRELAGRLQGLFEEHGFRVYTRAYSRHYLTNRSIPDTLGFEYERLDGAARMAGPDMDAQPYFRRLADLGYELTVFQSDLVRYCPAADVAACHTYRSFDPRSSYLPYSIPRRALYLLSPGFKTFRNSYVANYALQILGRLGVPLRFDLQGFPGWFDDVAASVLNAGPGDAIFAHFMIPHAPFVLDAECRQVRPGSTPYDLIDQYPDEADFLAARRSLYEHYAAQTQCMLSHLESLLDALERRHKLDAITFVIHGDHGSRISRSRYAEKMRDRDYIDNYSAHFSIRGPAIRGGADPRSISVQRLFAEYLGVAPRDATAGDADDAVIVQSEAGDEPKVVRMPVF